MHILLLGKIPPIQGGVSRSTWLACCDFARRGHSVDVVTNADAMGHGFRQMLDAADEAEIRSQCGWQAGGGRLCIANIAAIPPQSCIPWAPPYCSQLLGKAIACVSERRPDLVVGWYLEPYGVAAFIIGQKYGIPVILRHAGSDLGRLRDFGDLRPLYDAALSQAAAVVTGRNARTEAILKESGVADDALVRVRGRSLCGSFADRGRQFDAAELVAMSEAWFAHYGLEDDLFRTLVAWNREGLENASPVIGTYGKIGAAKGTYALLDALEILAAERVDLVLHGLWSASPRVFRHALAYLVGKPALRGRAVILPPLAPWRIPSFIRACSVVAFLENRFPIEFHGPQIPREVLACRRPLLLSEEIAQKVHFSEQLIDGVNVLRVADPNDTRLLADRMRTLVDNEELRNCLAHHGGAVSRVVEARALPVDPIVTLAEERIAHGYSEPRTASL